MAKKDKLDGFTKSFEEDKVVINKEKAISKIKINDEDLDDIINEQEQQQEQQQEESQEEQFDQEESEDEDKFEEEDDQEDQVEELPEQEIIVKESSGDFLQDKIDDSNKVKEELELSKTNQVKFLEIVNSIIETKENELIENNVVIKDIKQNYELVISKDYNAIFAEAVVHLTEAGKTFYHTKKYNGYDIRLDFSGITETIELKEKPARAILKLSNSVSYEEAFRNEIDKDGTIKTYGLVHKNLADKLKSDFEQYLGKIKIAEIKVGDQLRGSMFNNIIPNQITAFPDMMVLNVKSFDKLLNEVKTYESKIK